MAGPTMWTASGRQGFAIGALLALLAPAAFAQDYDPSMSAHESMSQQQFSTQQTEIGNHLLRQSVLRQRDRNRATQAQIVACARKARFRAEFGAGNPKVRRLYELCRGIGR